MTEIPCEQPFEDGTHCQEPRGHHLTAIEQAAGEIEESAE